MKSKSKIGHARSAGNIICPVNYCSGKKHLSKREKLHTYNKDLKGATGKLNERV